MSIFKCLETYLVWYLYQDSIEKKVLELGGKGDIKNTARWGDQGRLRDPQNNPSWES